MPKTRPVQRNPFTRTTAATPNPAESAEAIPAAIQPPGPRPETVELLPPSRLEPDPYQPRHPLLPPEIRARFYAGELDAYQAAWEWLANAAKAAEGHGREIRDLLAMGETFERDGQVNPITAYPLDGGEPGRFRIETGERRFWAAVLKTAANQPAGGGVFPEPLLRVVIVPGPSRARQLLENLHLETPTAVGQARGVAGLILERAGKLPPQPASEDTYAYFRQVLEIRLTEELVAYLEPIVKVKQRRIYQLLEILRLPSAALELADRARLPYLTLAAILSGFPPEDWLDQVAGSARESLENRFGLEDEGSIPPPAANGPHKPVAKTHIDPGLLAARGIRRFYNAAYRSWRTQGNALDTVANEIYAQGHAADTVHMLKELTALLDARIKGNKK